MESYQAFLVRVSVVLGQYVSIKEENRNWLLELVNVLVIYWRKLARTSLASFTFFKGKKIARFTFFGSACPTKRTKMSYYNVKRCVSFWILNSSDSECIHKIKSKSILFYDLWSMRMNTDPDRKILSKRFSREIWGSPCSHKFAPIYIAGVLKVYFCCCINESKKSEIKNQCWIVPRNRTISYLPVIRFSSNFWIPSWRCNRDFHYHQKHGYMLLLPFSLNKSYLTGDQTKFWRFLCSYWMRSALIANLKSIIAWRENIPPERRFCEHFNCTFCVYGDTGKVNSGGFKSRQISLVQG